MPIRRFEDLIAWKKGQELALNIYRCFGNNKDYDFVCQIKSAAVSISNNIAEGFDRPTKADFIRFLFYSSSSSSEVRSMLYLAENLKYVNEKEANSLRDQCIEISKIIGGLIKSLKK